MKRVTILQIGETRFLVPSEQDINAIAAQLAGLTIMKENYDGGGEWRETGKPVDISVSFVAENKVKTLATLAEEEKAEAEANPEKEEVEA